MNTPIHFTDEQIAEAVKVSLLDQPDEDAYSRLANRIIPQYVEWWLREINRGSDVAGRMEAVAQTVGWMIGQTTVHFTLAQGADAKADSLVISSVASLAARYAQQYLIDARQGEVSTIQGTEGGNA